MFSAPIPAQGARAIVRYRFLADRGDGSEVVSPRADDPVLSEVGPGGAREPWHGYSHPAGSPHAATLWEIRDATGDYERPLLRVTSTSALSALPIPFDALSYGQTY